MCDLIGQKPMVYYTGKPTIRDRAEGGGGGGFTPPPPPPHFFARININ